MQKKFTIDSRLRVGVLVLLMLLVGLRVIARNPRIIPSEERGEITLRSDKKEILQGGRVILSIDNGEVLRFFVEKSQLCDEANITTTQTRREYCQGSKVFRDKTNFGEIAVSEDNSRVGFSIVSNEMEPDSVVGILEVGTGKVTFLTEYYLGNKIVGFSPGGRFLAYLGECFEGLCGVYIRDTNDLGIIKVINGEWADSRTESIEEVRWVGEREIEYRVGGKATKESF